MSRVHEFWDAQAEWSRATFGSDQERGPIGPLRHLEKEAREAQQSPDDLTEKADCLFLIFDATRRSGKTLDELLDAAFAKLAINKERAWQTPAADEAIEHVRV